MAVIRCPICGKSFDSQTTSAMPFCSSRCRQVDLGRWLSEKHSIPHVSMDESEWEEDGEYPQHGGGQNDEGGNESSS